MDNASDISKISLENSQYPSLLKEIHDPPSALYIRGNTSALSQINMLAVVGSRNISLYSKRVIQLLLPDIVTSSTVIVSGLAYGVDSTAHKVSVDHNKPTIAVLGSGVDDESIYPKEHTSLAQEIIKAGGALISEYPPGTPPARHRFPARNRIIAGLCPATLIIQAARKSGSLITARLALENNREVGVIPGSILDEQHAGTNDLIKEGATPITSSEDIVELLNSSAAKPQLDSKHQTSIYEKT